MKKIALICLLCIVTSCSWFQKETEEYKPVVDGVIDCVKAEGAVIKKEFDVLSVAVGVATAIITTVANGGDPNPTIDALIAKYKPKLGENAESIVACAVKAYKTERSSAFVKTNTQDTAATIITKHNWRFAPSK